MDENCIVPGPPTLEGGVEAAGWVLARHSEVTALCVYNDMMALGALATLAGMRQPRASSARPVRGDRFRRHPAGVLGQQYGALSTVRVDKYDLGREARQCLWALLENPGLSPPAVGIAVELVVREST